MTKLATILNVPRFSDLTLLTPNSNINISVTSVEITETPDIANFTSSETLLLTTAMYYKDRQEELIELIDSLVNIRCSGLGIKVGRFITDIQPEVIAYAASRNFPLILIPSTKPLGGVLQNISSYINHTKTEQISYALDIQKQFSTLIINDAGIEKIILEFGDIVKCPIVLLNPFKEVVATSKDWERFSKPTTFLIDQLIKQEAFISTNEKGSLFVEMGESTKLETAIFPIKSNNYFPYYLIILTPEKIPYPVSEFAIEQALLVLSFVLLKNEKVEESQKLIKSDYFLNLIERQESSLLTQKKMLTYDANFGVRFSQFYQIVYVSLVDNPTSEQQLKLTEEKINIAYLWFEEKLHTRLPHSVIFPEKNQNELVILLQKQVTTDGVQKNLSYLAQQLQSVLPIDLVFSCGQPCETLDKISTSLIEAKIMFEERKHDLNSPLVSFYRPKGILNLFDNIQADETHYFCQSLLKKLAYPSDSMHQELRKTLKTFLDNQCEITKTANQLFIHRNTVKYRIDNCEDILGLTISAPEASLNLRLALELSEVP